MTRFHNKSFLWFVLTLMLLLPFFSGTLLAAERDSGFGLQISTGLALVSQPEEEGFSNQDIPFEFFLAYDLGPWAEFRIGFNSSKSATTTGVDSRLISRTAYVAYECTSRIFQPIDLFAYAGFAYFRSALEMNNGFSIATLENSSTGYILGVGGQYSFGLIGVGGQLQRTTSETNFGGVSYQIGANQLQMFIFYEF